jgi:hypothetical protein
LGVILGDMHHNHSRNGLKVGDFKIEKLILGLSKNK